MFCWDIDPDHNQAWIDVRSEKEFSEAHIPGFVNLPILNNEQRHLVGLCYKQEGKKQAIALGLELTSKDREQKLQAWTNAIQNSKTNSALVTCFRGGLRSRFAVEWMRLAGLDVHQIEGGYKAQRRRIFEVLSAPKAFLIVSGKTGSNKTGLIESFSHQSLDLENLARHRGSAFGSLGIDSPQPTQANFENLIGQRLFQNNLSTLFIEDESRHIGRLQVPEKIFKAIRNEPLLLVEEPVTARAQHIFRSYIQNPFQSGRDLQTMKLQFLACTQTIVKKLGGLKTSEVLKEMQTAFETSIQTQAPIFNHHQGWIEDLLLSYYDPCYEYGFEKAVADRKIIFRGNFKEVSQWMQTKSDSLKL